MPKILNLTKEEKRIRLNNQKMNWYYKKKKMLFRLNHKKKMNKVLNELKYKFYLKYENIDLNALRRKKKYYIKRIQILKKKIESFDIYLMPI